jgi:hypothetical protein
MREYFGIEQMDASPSKLVQVYSLVQLVINACAAGSVSAL